MAAEPQPRRLTVGALEVDLARYRGSFAGRSLILSPTQLELLAILVANRERLVSRAELSSAVGLRRDRSVDVALSAIRREVGRDFIRNVRKRGWVLASEQLEV
ncbi:MAG: winged helix-turn-helix domain-containing protein [Actinomycetota bacterium]